MNTTKRILATSAVGLAIVGGSLTLAATGIVGPAGAQSTTAESLLTRSEDGGGPGWFKRFREHRREVRRHVARLTADTIGITPDELRDELKSDKSIAQVATEHGVDPQAVIDTLVADANGRVDQALADGRINDEQAAKIKERLPEAVTKLVNHVFER